MSSPTAHPQTPAPAPADPELTTPTAPGAEALLVACLCAQWCGTCTEYARLFGELAAELAPARMVWVDIEDQAELVDPVEVDNFPTILIAHNGRAQFFGPVTPHRETLRRLVQSHASGGGAAVATPGVQALTERLGQYRPA